MPGFLGIIGEEIEGFSYKLAKNKSNLVVENISGNYFSIERATLNKFLLDKPFYQNENYIVLVEGVILNSLKIQENYNEKVFSEAIIKCYKAVGETFFNDFRGSFSGVLYDKRKNLWLIYTNQIGDKQVFYSKIGKSIIFGSEMAFLVDYYKHQNLTLTTNTDAAYMILSYGFLLENHTISNEIKKLNAGHYIKIIANKFEIKQYHQFNNEPDYSNSEVDFIEGIDFHFRNAIKLQFDKDIEYGYKHITTLSGGLDSRMTAWVAHQMGYIEQLNTTFSQSNYLDETIAKEIATDLKHEWLFKALDHGNFLKDLDNVTNITFGGASYIGLVHGKSLYDLVNFEAYGIIHTGQIGDSIIGTFYSKPYIEKKFKIGDGAYSTDYIHKLKDYQFIYDYPNQEIFKLYSRAFTGANQGLLVFQEKTESYSPFIDVDFLSYCYSIPVELRFKHKIYFDWIFNKYPQAANYTWERINDRIKPFTIAKNINILGKKVPNDKIFPWMVGAVKRRLPFLNKNQIPRSVSSNNMNPVDYWFTTNPTLDIFSNNYFTENIDLVLDIQLRADCLHLFNGESYTEKLQVLTLLSALKRIQ